MNVQDAVALYLGEQIATTATTYKWHLSDMVNFIGPARPLDSIDTADMLKYSQYVRAAKNIGEASQRQRLKTVKTFFNWLVKVGLIEVSPAKAIRLQRPRRAVDKDKAMSDDEYQAILGYFRQRAPHFYTMQRSLSLFLFLADTGCRASAAGRLKWSDIDFENLCAEVTEKGGKRCIVFFGDECRAQLRRWKLRRPKHAGEYVFNVEDKPLTHNAVSATIRRACHRLGIRTRSAHSLRHRKGHQLADSGVAVTVAATVLNHENPQTTMDSYYPADLERAQQAVRQLAEQPPDSTPENQIDFPGSKKTS